MSPPTHRTLTTTSASASASAAAASDGAAPLPLVLHTIAEVRALVSAARAAGQSVGFVPTMGALHSGHVSLAAQSLQENHLTLVSVFVNPTQFLPGEDLDAYPRTLQADRAALGALSAAAAAQGKPAPVVFAPSAVEMYPGWPATTGGISVDLAGADQSAEGSRRPGHFRGVATVVSKLLHIAQADRAYFGQKDGMQCIVVRALVKELNFPCAVRICPTQRAKDGLALSSRNVYLSAQERAVAPVLFRALEAANALYNGGERSVARLKAAARSVLEAQPMGTLEYVSIAAADSGIEMSDDATLAAAGAASTGDDPAAGGAMLSIAYKLGKPRLIDNCILGQPLQPGTDV